MSSKTKHQHTTPQMILKRFSFETERRRKIKKYKVWVCEKNSAVTYWNYTDKISVKKNVYETRKNGEIINRNRIENGLSKIEDAVSKILDKIENKEILSEEDIALTKVFMIMQFLRTPKAIKEGGNLLKEMSSRMGKVLSDEEADFYFKVSSFGYGCFDEKTQWVFKIFFDAFAKRRQFVIYDSKINILLDGENPTININDYLFLPVSSNICLGLVHLQKTNQDEVDCSYIRKEIDIKIFKWFNQQTFNHGNILVSQDEDTFNFYSKAKLLRRWINRKN